MNSEFFRSESIVGNRVTFAEELHKFICKFHCCVMRLTLLVDASDTVQIPVYFCDYTWLTTVSPGLQNTCKIADIWNNCENEVFVFLLLTSV